MDAFLLTYPPQQNSMQNVRGRKNILQTHTPRRQNQCELRGETLNYKMVAMDDFKPAYLGIHWCHEFSF